METQHFMKQPGKVLVKQFKYCANGRLMPTSKIEADSLLYICVVKMVIMKHAASYCWQVANQTSKTM